MSSQPPTPTSPPPLPTDPAPLPTLSTHTTTDQAQLILALKLIADSIAQQRQTASYAVITHPYTLSGVFLLLVVLSQYIATALFLTTAAGFIMAFLVAVRGFTGGYLEQAERIGWLWLGEGRGAEAGNEGDEVVVVVSEWAEKIIGALVLRIVRRDRTAYVRAWTTGLRYRRTGVGRELLEEGVRVAMGEKGCRNVVFDKAHANSKRILPATFNRGFDRRDALARSMLADVVARREEKGGS